MHTTDPVKQQVRLSKELLTMGIIQVEVYSSPGCGKRGHAKERVIQ